MQNKQLVEEAKIALAASKWFFQHLGAYVSNAYSNARDSASYPENRGGVDDWAEVQSSATYTETGDYYVPAYSVSKIIGDGYNFTFNNTSAFNKQVNYSIRHEYEVEHANTPPPLFDEGDKNV